MFCKNCGAEIESSDLKVCPYCDSELDLNDDNAAPEAEEVNKAVSADVAEPAKAEVIQTPPTANTAAEKNDTGIHKLEKIGNRLKWISLVLLFLVSLFKAPIGVSIILAIGVAVGLVLSAVGAKRPWGLGEIMSLLVGVFLLITFMVLVPKLGGGSDDKYIQMVKNGTLESYPQMTVGEAFDGYLDNPKWETGMTEDKQRFVNVKGGILYYDENAEIAVQFFINEKDKSFQYYACEVNGQPQNDAVVSELFGTIYEENSLEEQNQAEQTTSEQAVEAPVTNAPVYDVDELGNLLDTRSVDLYNEGSLLYGKYEQCESINTDGEYGVRYGDLTILSSEASEGIVQISTTNPKTFQKNGLSLDKSETELTAIFGEAEFGGQEQGGYYLTFLCNGYSLSAKFNDPAKAPYEIILHY